MNDDTVRKTRKPRRKKRSVKRVPAVSRAWLGLRFQMSSEITWCWFVLFCVQSAIYLSFEEQQSLKMRRRLKQRLKNTKSTMGDTFRQNTKREKQRRAQKKILQNRKGKMAKQRAQEEIDNKNRHLLKKILKLHFRNGDAATGTAEPSAAAGGGGKGTVRFHRHADNRTSYMRQRYKDLTKISRDNQRMISKLLKAKPAVETKLSSTTK